MSVTNIAKTAAPLDSCEYVPAYRASRQKAPQGHLLALSVVIGRTVEDPWLVEIGAVAVAWQLPIFEKHFAQIGAHPMLVCLDFGGSASAS